jgi:3-hydroxy acid dehydrogenase / malonic semialdehyde reductase
MKRIALISGASAGIGEATAIRFAKEDYSVIISGRRVDRIEALADTIRKEYHVEALPLVFDIRSREETENALNGIPENWKRIDVLVNNAGLALGLDKVQEGDPADWDQMIDTNVKGLLYLSRIVIPWMVEKGEGHVINIGSIAGKEVYPKGNIYSATKHAVDAITKGMRIDLLGTGVRVTQVAPGAVETEFSIVRFKGDEDRAAKVYQGYDPLRPEDIADVAYYVTTLPKRVNINDILIMPTAQANATTFIKK